MLQEITVETAQQKHILYYLSNNETVWAAAFLNPILYWVKLYP